jgi:putative membrane protein
MNNQKIITSLLLVGVVAVMLSGIWYISPSMWGTEMMHGWGGMGWGMGFFWILILLGFFLLFSERYPIQNYDGRDRAIEIARERYARGELTEEEFKQVMRNL